MLEGCSSNFLPTTRGVFDHRGVRQRPLHDCVRRVCRCASSRPYGIDCPELLCQSSSSIGLQELLCCRGPSAVFTTTTSWPMADIQRVQRRDIAGRVPITPIGMQHAMRTSLVRPIVSMYIRRWHGSKSAPNQ